MLSPQPSIKSLDVFDSNESSTVMILNELVRKSDTKKSRDHSFTINKTNSHDYSNIPYHLLSKLEFVSIDDRRNLILEKLNTTNHDSNENVDVKRDEFIKLFECTPITGFTKRKNRLRFFQHEIMRKKEMMKLKKLKRITEEKKKITDENQSLSLPQIKT